MYKNLLTIITILLLVGCDTQRSSEPVTYFEGEIINPKSNFVTFKKGKTILDTLYLDSENKFFGKFHGINEGVFSFGHGNEVQYLFLEQQDSISISLNTFDFDESLVFSGKGSEKNEYLINLFLENEKDSEDFYHYYKLSPQEFKDRIILTQELKHAQFQEFETEQNNLSEKYIEIVLATIDYPLLKKMEYYPIANKKVTNASRYPILTDDFYDYREGIDINNSALIEYYAYTNYIINYLYNQAFCSAKPHKGSMASLRLCFFKSIEKNITIESFKNQLLMGNILHNILKGNNSEDQDVLKLFLKISSNVEDKKRIKKLLADKKALTNNQTISNFEILTPKGEKREIKDLIQNKESVIYFWSNQYMSSEYLNSRIEYLTKKHPSVNFIGINMDSNPQLTTSEKYILKNRYQLTSKSIGYKYNSSGYPRTIVLSKDGLTTNSYTNISSKDFSYSLSSRKKN